LIAQNENIYSQNTYFNQTNNSNGYHYKLQRKQCVQSKKKASRRAKRFYGNPFHTVVVIPFNIYNLNLPHFQWFGFLLWDGVGLIMHALKVYGYSSNWEERKIQEIYKRGQTRKLN
jgi:hypothetical protein